MKSCVSAIFAAIVFFCLCYASASASGSGDAMVRIEGMRGKDAEFTGMLADARRELRAKTGLDLDFPVTLRFETGTGNEMVVAYALPHESTAVFDYARINAHPLDFRLTLMHEAAHLLLHRNIRPVSLPKWFDEGVAQWVSGGVKDIIHPNDADILRRAVVSGGLISLYRLERNFPADRDGFALAYEESKSMMDFIERKHGSGAIRAIIARLASGAMLHEAVLDSTGVHLYDLERDWAGQLRTQHTWFWWFSDNIEWFLFVFAAMLTAGGFAGVMVKMRNYRDEEEDDSADAEQPPDDGMDMDEGGVR
ncbi:MAG: hypothetical protein HZA20_03955 [Nitrospirae bacterium]|nr:hypothetical protein [Nitrospirota bacterium]